MIVFKTIYWKLTREILDFLFKRVWSILDLGRIGNFLFGGFGNVLVGAGGNFLVDAGGNFLCGGRFLNAACGRSGIKTDQMSLGLETTLLFLWFSKFKKKKKGERSYSLVLINNTIRNSVVWPKNQNRHKSLSFSIWWVCFFSSEKEVMGTKSPIFFSPTQ